MFLFTRMTNLLAYLFTCLVTYSLTKLPPIFNHSAICLIIFKGKKAHPCFGILRSQMVICVNLMSISERSVLMVR